MSTVPSGIDSILNGWFRLASAQVRAQPIPTGSS